MAGTLTWPGPDLTNTNCLDQDIFILSGSTVTINDNIEIVKDVLITVRAGGKLIIEGPGTTLSLSSACTSSDSWKGILVQGTNYERQRTGTGTYALDNYYSAQGLVKATNAAFRDMSNGIESVNGGIIVAKKCNFINNRHSIQSSSYTYEGPPENIANLVEDCYFAWDEPWYNETNYSGRCFIFLWDVAGFEIAGCIFNNADGDPYDLTVDEKARGIGIKIIGSNFLVHQTGFNAYVYADNDRDEYNCPKYDGTPIRSSFNTLSYGILIENPSPTEDLFTVAYTDFHTNHLDISANNIKIDPNTPEHKQKPCVIGKNNTFNFNHFTFDARFTTPASHVKRFISFDAIEKFVITDNEFIADRNGKQEFIRINNTGTGYSRIYRNFFEDNGSTHEESYANYIDGPNGGLLIECNDYEDFYYDWYLTNDATVGTTREIHLNTFSKTGPPPPAPDYDIFVEPGNPNSSMEYKFCAEYATAVNKPVVNSNFTVSPVADGCSVNCDELRCPGDPETGINSPATRDDRTVITILPNPSRPGTTVTLSSSEKILNLTIINAQGKLIAAQSGYDITKINLPDNLTPGIYLFILTTSDNQLLTTKVLVND
ncbi:MAG: T9SS type A sorting domain-containing protein [Bacteroidia bacterium]